MQNKWKNAGCIRRFPYSQSCQPRSVAWMRSPAASCVRPAASRAAFTCAGVGLLAALPARLRLGWLVICHGSGFQKFFGVANSQIAMALFCVYWACFTIWNFPSVYKICEHIRNSRIYGACAVKRSQQVDCFDYCHFHFILQPLFPRRGVGRANNSQSTRFAYNCKNYFNYFLGRKTSPLT